MTGPRQQLIKRMVINTAIHEEIDLLLFHYRKELKFNGMVGFSVPRQQFYFGASQTLIFFGGGTPTTARAVFSALGLLYHEGKRFEQYAGLWPLLMKIWSCCTKKIMEHKWSLVTSLRASSISIIECGECHGRTIHFVSDYHYSTKPIGSLS